ncbi:MAG: hypothetical protein AAFR14_04145, partial [Bacteroidota bacterium]
NGGGSPGDISALSDEDDHDPEFVRIIDLALVKELISTDVNNGDTLDYVITTTNQGNVPMSEVVVNDYIPAGFVYSGALNAAQGWAGTDGVGPITVSKTVTMRLEPGASRMDTISVILMQTGGPASDYINYGEIASMKDTLGIDVSGQDVDSEPNSDSADERETMPGDAGDNDLMSIGRDSIGSEDDHDPAGPVFFDLALRKTIAPTAPSPVRYGDRIPYVITVFNQGTVTADSIEVRETIPAGLRFNTSDNTGWTASGANAFVTTITVPLAPGDSTSVMITLEVLAGATGQDDYTNIAEISRALDEEGNPTEDIDSTPDDDPDNDGGDGPESDDDDEIDEDGKNVPGDDEDDQDGAIIRVVDLALIKVKVPGTYDYGDVIPFVMTTTNQGNVVATDIAVNEYIPSGFRYEAANNVGQGWIGADASGPTSVYKILEDTLALGESATDTIFLILEASAGGPLSYINFAEIGAVSDTSGNVITLDDADSTPGSDTPDENRIRPGMQGDNDIVSTGINDTGSEDDHDPAGEEVFDLAVIIDDDINQLTAFGDVIPFSITLANQGNVDSDRPTVTVQVPDGFMFGMNMGWTFDEMSGLASFTLTDTLSAGEVQLLSLNLIAQPSSAMDAWTPTIEITDDNPISDDPNLMDRDSRPDMDFTNDPGGNATPDAEGGMFPGSDDILTGDGLNGGGAPGDVSAMTDEDDHDRELFRVFDLALIKQFEFPDSIYLAGEIIEMNIEIINQGNVVANTVEVTEYVPASIDVDISQNTSIGWMNTSGTTPSFSYTGPLAPGQRDTIKLFGQFQIPPGGGQQSDFINIAEISDAGDDEGNTIGGGTLFDADSTPDRDESNDGGGGVATTSDDVVDGDGSGIPGDDDPATDEDDHDPLQLAYFDVALRKTLSSPTTPVSVGDVVTFDIEIINQGLIDVQNLVVSDYIPAGYDLIDPAWMEVSPGVAQRTITDVIPFRTSVVTSIMLRVNSQAQAANLINVAEITSFQGVDGIDRTNEDIDSQGDADPTNDPGGQIFSDADNFISGDGKNGGGTAGDGVSISDEDDSDPATVSLVDVALIKTISSPTGPVITGSDVTFQISVFNQGNVVLDSIDVIDFIPDGYMYSAMSDALGWTVGPDGTTASTVVVGPVEGGGVRTLNLILTLRDGATISNTTNTAEVVSVVDTSGNEVGIFDIDSTPGDDNENAITQVGTPDDDNPDTNSNEGESQDDADPAVTPIFDLAIQKRLAQDQPRAGLDIVTFEIEVYNQGNLDAIGFVITDYIPAGLAFVEGINDDWSFTGNNTYELSSPERIRPGESIVFEINLRILEVMDANDLVNVAEISAVALAEAPDGTQYVNPDDYDSEPDNVNDDTGSEPFSPLDDVLDQNGRLGGDEDDNDQAFPIICESLACIAEFNLNMDGECNAIVTPRMIFGNGLIFPDAFYEITITDQHGRPHPNQFDASDKGESFSVTVESIFCEGLSCWGTVNIEQKALPPTVGMIDTVHCGIEKADLPWPRFDLFGTLNGGCYAWPVEDSEPRVTITDSGELCDTIEYIREIAVDFALDKRKRSVVMRRDTIIVVPLTKEEICYPPQWVEVECEILGEDYDLDVLDEDDHDEIREILSIDNVKTWFEERGNTAADTLLQPYIKKEETVELDRIIYCVAERKFDTGRDTLVQVETKDGAYVWTSVDVFEYECVDLDTAVVADCDFFKAPEKERLSLSDNTFEGRYGDCDQYPICLGATRFTVPAYKTLDKGTTCNMNVKCTEWVLDGQCERLPVIMRKWEILDWCDPTKSVMDSITYVKVVDRTAPKIEDRLDDVWVSIEPWTCVASYTYAPEVKDWSGYKVSISIDEGVIDYNADQTTAIISGLWLEASPVEAIATIRDWCGNETRDTFEIYVKDDTPPVAIATDQLNITLTGDHTNSDEGIAKVYVDDVDAGSHDAGCGKINRCLLRKDEIDNPLRYEGDAIDGSFK